MHILMQKRHRKGQNNPKTELDQKAEKKITNLKKQVEKKIKVSP
jgi:hypothetical protein